MIIKRILTSAAVAATVAFGAVSVADAAPYKIDGAHTAAVFKINHLGYSTMWGRFNEVSGSYDFDPADLATAKIKVVINTQSIDTNHKKRDDHLRSPDFFNAVEFPKMTFESTKIEKTGDNTGSVTGNLTLMGVTKTVVLAVNFNKAAVHPFDGKKPADQQRFMSGFSATGKINRSDYGIKYGVPMIGDEVELFIEVEGQRQ